MRRPVLAAALALVPALAHAGWRDARGWDRPILEGPSDAVTSADGRFRVHWSIEGPDAPRGGDTDADGVPDSVVGVLAALEEGRLAFEARGYRPIAHDDGSGGDDALDVYLLPIDANGYAYPLRGAAPEGGAACFIELDSGLSGAILASVAQHELHHCVQYRYAVGAHPWIYEATATWEQYLLAPESLDVALQLLYAARLAEPDRPLQSRGDRYEYAGFLVLKHLEEYRRPAVRAPDLWEALADEGDWQISLGAVTADAFDLSLAAWFGRYATWNAFACGRDDGAHYAPEPAGCTSPASVPITSVDVGAPFAVTLPETRFTAAYLRVDAAGDDRPVAVTCGDPGGGEWSLSLIAVDRDGAAGTTVHGGPTGRALDVRLPSRIDRQGEVVLVAASVGERPLDVRCTASRVAPLFEEAGGCRSAPTDPGPWWLGVGLAWWRRRRAPAPTGGRSGTPGRTRG